MDNFQQRADGLKGDFGRKAGGFAKPLISLVYLRDLILALTISGIGLLGYGLHLLLAIYLNPAAAAIATACIFGVLLWILKRGVVSRFS